MRLAAIMALVSTVLTLTSRQTAAQADGECSWTAPRTSDRRPYLQGGMAE
jgi:hypothetical protein